MSSRGERQDISQTQAIFGHALNEFFKFFSFFHEQDFFVCVFVFALELPPLLEGKEKTYLPVFKGSEVLGRTAKGRTAVSKIIRKD